MSFHEVQDFLDALAEDHAAALARGAEKGDWCPVCGYSESEHTGVDTENCTEAYYAGEALIMKMELKR